MGPSSLRWSRMLAVIVALVVVGEIGVRFGTERVVGRPFDSFDGYSFSGYGVFRQNPRYTHPAFINNAQGFRNLHDFPLEKPKGGLRVMALGASVLYSGSAQTHEGASPKVHTRDTIGELLQPLLAERPTFAQFDEVEVMNASVNRTRLRQTIAAYIGELGKYHPDVVLVFGTFNDTYAVDLEGGRETFFYQPNAPEMPEEERTAMLLNGDSVADLSEKLVRVLSNRSALFALAERGLERTVRNAHARGARFSFEQSGAPHAEPSLASPEELERNIDHYLATLGALLTYIEGTGAQPVVFWEYMLLELEGIKPYSDYEMKLAAYLKQLTGGLSPERIAMRQRIRDRLASYLAQRNIPLIDILDRVRSYRGNLFNDYLHYNGEGNRWVAGVVAEELDPIVSARWP